ncbi:MULTISPECIES: DUF3703 domain-containing protein [Diaphorobacter]|uniref:DUF3703 domain-containing protein n=1 Tax=Diaphorobacter TaxID=238749 RepID=UPI0005A06563|nr:MULTISPECIES: DUF3703 domain-containing protein [Diaphorobacter]
MSCFRYPLIFGTTAAVLFGGLAAGWPYFPTVPLTVAAALAWRMSNVAAQVVRLALAPLGHSLGSTPPQNVGTGRYGVMERGTWPPELDPITFQRR